MDTQEIVVSRNTVSDRSRVEAMVEECLPTVRKWAHRRLPAAARGCLETCDLVQEVALRMLKKGDQFDVRHPFAVQGYMQRALTNLIRDEIRKTVRRPAPVELPEQDELPSPGATPLDAALDQDAAAQYRRGLAKLRDKDRHLIVAHIERGLSAQQIEKEFGFPSTNAARVAVSRALGQLARQVALLQTTPKAAASQA